MTDELILPERLETAAGPLRDLDVEIAKLVGAKHGPEEVVHLESRSVSYFDEIAPRYTASLNAAMTLVPEGWAYRVWHSENRKHASATVDTSHLINRACFAESSTPALALCAAALRTIIKEIQ